MSVAELTSFFDMSPTGRTNKLWSGVSKFAAATSAKPSQRRQPHAQREQQAEKKRKARTPGVEGGDEAEGAAGGLDGRGVADAELRNTEEKEGDGEEEEAANGNEVSSTEARTKTDA